MPGTTTWLLSEKFLAEIPLLKCQHSRHCSAADTFHVNDVKVQFCCRMYVSGIQA